MREDVRRPVQHDDGEQQDARGAGDVNGLSKREGESVAQDDADCLGKCLRPR